MKEEKVRRRDFVKKVPLFGAGLALGLSALAEAGEVPKARKLAGGDVEPLASVCNTGTCNVGNVVYDCTIGAGSLCFIGSIKGIVCNVGTCNIGY